MDSEDRIENTRIENIYIIQLKDYFIDLEDVCDDFVECYKKEQKCYLEEEKFNMILEEESRLVDTLYEITSSIKKEFKDILDAFEMKATERERRRVAISRELNKKPRVLKDN
ncbi:hypothetical protein KM1_192160 [Entamoeba histolytica HM-3:IMSS]|uniref:Uncharacterized protein n=2 Tax=Entamoeba histolytica TaxID=5759 RepID=M2RDM5_ENTHI|nr:Hypothetical protein EHI5A_175330 [Entamoeba histolytica KU27]EMS15481.1 hypothetical protein KM1_192160 [Entamoeba histolytica HM-3:IMSS]